MNAYWHQHDHMALELQWPNCVSRSPEHTWCLQGERNRIQNLKRNKTMEEINNSLYNPSGFERGRLRLAELVKKECRSKCELISYVDAFWKKTMNAFQCFDAKGFTYFTAGYHLSAHGIEHVRPLYRDICDNL